MNGVTKRWSGPMFVALVVLVACTRPGPGESPLPPSPLPIDAEELDHRVYVPGVFRYRRPAVANPSFEGGQWQGARWWSWPWQAVYTGPFNEVRPPEGWTAWWLENRFCEHNESFKSGRPEVTLITPIEDGRRVVDGEKALKFFTFFRCHYGGIVQTIRVQPGEYRFGALAHYWYSNCSTRPYDPPLRTDCSTPISPYDKGTITLGISAVAAQDYWSEDVLWSQDFEAYGGYGDMFWSPWVESDGFITLWVKGETYQPLKHNDLYVDAVMLEWR